MALDAGTRLGPYEIVGLIGTGGMGQVYRATDIRLHRTVAVKLLHAHLTDPEYRARFEREARSIASLSHPHICTIYDVGEHGSSLFLVMEHLSGETLAERLRRGALPVGQVLEVGTQIAHALSVAHRAGIIHRDLKPANVMLTKSGVKLLDFGVAKHKATASLTVLGSAASQWTPAVPLTETLTILGTPHYMAPEQFDGREPDARTDIWALGIVLYEMLTGRRAFEGSGQASLIGAILEKPPAPLGSGNQRTASALERLVLRCLEKDPDDRWDGAHDVADELSWIKEWGEALQQPDPLSRPWRIARACALVAAGIALGAGVMWQSRPGAASDSRTVRSLVDVSPAEEVNAGGVPSIWIPTAGGSRTALAWTPDGRTLVFIGRRTGVQQVYVRALDTESARSLPGTEGAQVPVVSADGRWVAFWATGAIRKVPLAGGPVTTVVGGVADPPTGMAWGSNGALLYPSEGVIWRASPGEAPVRLTKVRPGDWGAHQFPQWLPGDEAILYTIRKGEDRATGSLVAQRLGSSEVKLLVRDAVDGRYVAGRLLFMRQGVLLGVPFDARRLQVVGEPVALISDVSQALTSYAQKNITGAGQFSVSSDGSLAYVAGSVTPYPESRVVVIDRAGRATRVDMPPGTYLSLRVSRNGRRIAATSDTREGAQASIFDTQRKVLTRIGGEGELFWPIWNPNSDTLAFAEFKDGSARLIIQGEDPTSRSVLFEALSTDSYAGPSAWPFGKPEIIGLRHNDIWVFPADRPGKGRALFETPALEMWPELSPDGHWLVYGSDASGRMEVYIQPYPGPGRRTQVSAAGGGSPAWSRLGDELFFITPPDSRGESDMMAVPVTTESSQPLGVPQRLFSFRHDQIAFSCVPLRCYDVTGEGSGFLTVQTAPISPPEPARHINLVQHWFEELRTKIPGE